jgi:sugar/nucleoside kinase (ribokinase family)
MLLEHSIHGKIMFDIICVGILVSDVIIKPVDTLPGKGLLGLVDSIRLFSGGNAMTAAVITSKLGLSSVIAGKIGNDAFGEFIKGVLKSNNVNCAGLVVDEKIQTAASVVLSNSDGERTFLHCPGTNNTFSIDNICWDLIEKSKLIFFTGTFVMETFDGEQTRIFLQKCKEKGKTTALDLCWDAKGRWSELLFPALQYVDFFLPSFDEARELTGSYDLDLITDTFIRSGAKTIIIKLGKDGCFLRENKNTKGYIIPACKNITPIDTTGAGDNFCSGFLTAYTKGMSLHDCACFANAAGALSVMAQGATTGITCYDSVLKLMQENYQ